MGGVSDDLLRAPFRDKGRGDPADGIDCVGAVKHWLHTNTSIRLPDDLPDVVRVDLVAQGDIQPGDVLAFYKDGEEAAVHAGVYIGEGRVLHCGVGVGVFVHPLSRDLRLRPEIWRLSPDGEHERRTTSLGVIGGGIFAFLISLAVSITLAGIQAAISYEQIQDLQDQLEGRRGGSATFSARGIETVYQEGSPIPLVLGEHDVGGIVVEQEIPTHQANQPERMRITVLLCEGPVHSVGGRVTPGGGLDFPPITAPYPKLRIDDVEPNPATTTYAVMLGRTDQGRTPREPIGLDEVNAQLKGAGDEIDFFVPSPDASLIDVILDFPQGLWKNGSHPKLTMKWRMYWTASFADGSIQGWQEVTGGQYWATAPNPVHQLDQLDVRQGFTIRMVAPVLPPPGSPASFDGYRIRVVRVSQNRDEAQHSDVWFDQLWVRRVHSRYVRARSYNGFAWIHADLEVTEAISRIRPQPKIRTRVTGSLVPFYAHQAWRSPTWFASSYNYGGPLGRNPAWQVAYLVRNTEAIASLGLDVDGPSFERWARYCELNRGDGQVLFATDLVLDGPFDAWGVIGHLFELGHAIRIVRGSTLFAIPRNDRAYQYLAGYTPQATPIWEIVPERQRMTILTSANIEDLVVSYTPRGEIPSQVEGIFSSKDQGYERQVLLVEDPDYESITSVVELSEPRVTRSFDLTGLTERDRVVRELWYRLQSAKLRRKQVTFVAGIEMLPFEPGDLFGFQSEIYRPQIAGDATSAARLTSISGLTVTLDARVDAPAGAGTRKLILRNPGRPDPDQEYVIQSPGAVLEAGEVIELDRAVTGVDVGALAVVVDVTGQIEDYEVTDMRFAADGKIRITALIWVPEVFEDPPPTAFMARARPA